jgi:hypothetical protein
MEWQTADSNLFKKQSGKQQWQTADSKLFKNQSGKHARCVNGPTLLWYSSSLFKTVSHFGLMVMLRLCCIKHQGNWHWPWWWLCWCFLSMLVSLLSHMAISLSPLSLILCHSAFLSSSSSHSNCCHLFVISFSQQHLSSLSCHVTLIAILSSSSSHSHSHHCLFPLCHLTSLSLPSHCHLIINSLSHKPPY